MRNDDKDDLLALVLRTLVERDADTGAPSEISRGKARRQFYYDQAGFVVYADGSEGAFELRYDTVGRLTHVEHLDRALLRRAFDPTGNLAIEGSIELALERIHAAGITPERVRALLDGALVSPVLTAHPTEVQRKSILDCQAEISRLLTERDRTRLTPEEQAHSDTELRRVVLTLWQTRVLRELRLTVDDEIENGLSYYRRTFFRELPRLYGEIEDRLAGLGAAPAAVELWAPSLAGDERFADWFAKFARQSLSRRDVVPFLRSIAAYDLVDVFPAVRVPALVLHRTDDALIPVSHARWIAQQIPEARLVELPGVDHLPFAGDAEAVAGEIEAFLVGPGASEPRGRRLLTVVATDIADATSMMTRLGDRAWRELLAAHDRELDEHLARFGGRRVTPLSESCLAVFDGPARAIRCAVGIVDAAARLGLGVRAGLHCGECETVEDDVRGIAVHIGGSIAELARPGEVLASGTVRDLVAGSGIRFGPGRDVELQGLPGRRTVLPVRAGGASPEDIRRLAIEQANVLRRDGEYWTVAYEGTVATLRDSKGLRDLARLLAAPGRELHVLDLATEQAAEGEAISRRAAADAGLHLDSGAAEPVIDEAARTAYRQRLAAIEQELDDAHTRRDADAAARARVEREALVEQLTAAYGLGGRPRRTPDHVERARKTVSRRIRSALRRIDDLHPALGRHLHASLRTGVYCSYQPEHDLHWTIKTS